MYDQAKVKEREFKIIFKVMFSFLPGLVSEQTSKMAQT